MFFSRRRALLAFAGVGLLVGCAADGSGDALYRPQLGQAGKDVMWVPTLDEQAVAMLEAAGVTASDLVFDLGSGDGKIPILAAQRFGARAVGIEYDPKLSELAQRNAQRAGVTDRVRMIQGDLFLHDFSAATVLTLYLGEALNQRLRPLILAMRPGTRVVSNLFGMDPWVPDRTLRVGDQNPIHFWIVPALVAGDWMLTGLPEGPSTTLRLRQTHQFVDGTLGDPAGASVPVKGRLAGSTLTLEYRGAGGVARRVVGEVSDGELRARVQGEGGAQVSGRRVR